MVEQKNETESQQSVFVPETERTKTTDQDERQKFYDWMLSSGISKATIKSYMSSFGQCVKSVANYKLCETSLWNVSNAEDASHISTKEIMFFSAVTLQRTTPCK